MCLSITSELVTLVIVSFIKPDESEQIRNAYWTAGMVIDCADGLIIPCKCVPIYVCVQNSWAYQCSLMCN